MGGGVGGGVGVDIWLARRTVRGSCLPPPLPPSFSALRVRYLLSLPRPSRTVPYISPVSPLYLPCISQAIEDRLNAASDSEFGVQSIILVEDNVKFYSTCAGG